VPNRVTRHIHLSLSKFFFIQRKGPFRGRKGVETSSPPCIADTLKRWFCKGMLVERRKVGFALHKLKSKNTGGGVKITEK
jgi:hypothetical protein